VLGWLYAGPGHVPPFLKTYPEDPARPNKLMPPARESGRKSDVMPVRFPHPVTAMLWNV
jgi:hypothetical protein